MKKVETVLLFLILAVFLMAGNAFALLLGTNITIPDGMGSGTGWHGAQEDQEVEPSCLTGQIWDLEGFFLNGSTLYMVGGYDFVNGEREYDSGDIFFDVDYDAVYGTDNTGSGSGLDVVANTFGYEYALRLDFSTSKYTLYDLTSPSTTVAVYHGQNDESNPWRYNDGGLVNSIGNFETHGYGSDGPLSDADVGGLLGDEHYAVSFFLPSVIPVDNFLVHFTYECGNDNMMGKVPEPSTMLLLGFGLVGLAAVGRKRFH